MIEILKKRFSIGDSILVRTTNNSFTGIIETFEDNCLVIVTEDGNTEFISNDSITGASATKEQKKSSKAIITEDSGSEKTKNQDEDSTNKKVISPITKQIGLKIVGQIDPKQFEKEQKKKAKKNSKFSCDKPQRKFSSLGDLQQIILPQLEEENKRLVPAKGIVKVFFPERNYGFIRDKDGYDIWFNQKSICDDELIRELWKSSYSPNIPVLFTFAKNYRGNLASQIHKPKSVEKIIELANAYVKNAKYDSALCLVEQILDAYPENITAENFKNKIETQRSNRKPLRPMQFTNRPFDVYYHRARAFNNNKNHLESLRYYLLALENNERRETCIKDIAMLYIAMGEPQKALDFISRYEEELPKTITNCNYLENFYSSAKRFDKVIEYIELLLDKTKITDKRKYSMYLSRKAFCLIQLKNIDDARIILEKAVTIEPENTYASRLLNALNEADSEELSQAIAEAEFDSFSGGLSKFIKDTLDSYDEFFGVPAKVLDSRDFTLESLNSTRKLIETAGRARPRERANYLLTEAKLMQILEPEKDITLRSVLARYCSAMALNHISENSSMDVIRSFFLEAFSLEEKYQSTAPQVALYLISYKSSYTELLSTKTPSIDESLEFILEGESKEYIWEGILSLFLWNRSISAQLISKLFYKKNYYEKSLIFLTNIGLCFEKVNNIEDYSSLWGQAREKRQRDFSRWLASIKSIYLNTELETLTGQLFESLAIARQSWLSLLDNHRLNTISTEILDILNEYIRQSSFDDKERCYNFAKAQINQLSIDIKEKPTKFSYEGFLPLLEQINILLDKSFKKALDASSPKVKISILSDSSVVLNSNIVPFQICISNSLDSSPIRDICVHIQNDENISFIEDNNVHLDSIKGGANCILRLSIKVSAKVIEDKATTLRVVSEYKTRNDEQSVKVEQQLSLRLFSEDEFESIENPFAPIADGGPVENKKMFYGREEFIETISKALLNADSKQVIIYGQKRSGKSSVLFHLKKRLEESNQTFCVLFSLGLIIDNLTSSTFYYKILSSIEEELENLRYMGSPVPRFECPKSSDFDNHQNPADLFRKIISSFKKECKLTEGWNEKKLIVMIDEFTYLYTAIRKGTTSDSILKQWKAITQNENAKFSVVLVGQDVVPTFKNEEYAKNAFGVIQDIRLTYLAREDAIKLIEEPIWDTKLKSNRFIGDAIASIIDYTSCNPYYIQIFCARLVDYLNRKKITKATEADIKEVADSFINGEQALTADKFDNLLKAGEKYDFQEIPPEDSVRVLRKIANGAKNIGYCPREYITINNPEYEEKILKDLTNREVLEKKENNYKIQVKLFQEWLLKH